MTNWPSLLIFFRNFKTTNTISISLLYLNFKFISLAYELQCPDKQIYIDINRVPFFVCTEPQKLIYTWKLRLSFAWALLQSDSKICYMKGRISIQIQSLFYFYVHYFSLNQTCPYLEYDSHLWSVEHSLSSCNINSKSN